MSSSRRGLTYEELEVGARFETAARAIRAADVEAFGRLTGDRNPLHDTGGREPALVHGLLAAAVGAGLTHELGVLAGTTVALVEQRLRFERPVRAGDAVRRRLEVTARRPAGSRDAGI